MHLRGRRAFFVHQKRKDRVDDGKKCLQAAAATQNAQMFIAKCQNSVALQVWMLSR
jgi:hypothetical protein